jgi:tetratricopeptide (TPR) repeat protein
MIYMRLSQFFIYVFLISLAFGCSSMQESVPPEPVRTEPVVPEVVTEPVPEVTPEMVEEYARIHQISDLKTAEYYLTHPDYAKENPYTPTEEDIELYERDFLEKVYPGFRKLAEKEGFMKARRIYMENPPYGGRSRRIGTTRYNKLIQRLASGSGAAELMFENDPVEIHYREGMRLYKAGQVDDAIEEMKKAVKIKPDAPAILYNLGVMYIGKGDYPKAMQSLKDSLYYIKETGFTKLNLAMYSDAYVGSLVNLGLIYSRIGMYNEAVEALEEAIQFRPEDQDANRNLGTVYYLMGDMEKASEQMRRYLELDPDNAEVHNFVGLMYYRKKLYNAALDEFQTAVKLAPGEKLYNHNLGLVLAELGRNDEANKAFENASGLEEGEEMRRVFAQQTAANKVRKMYNDGYDALQRLDYKRAIELFEAVLKLDPNMVEAHFNLGVCYRARGDVEKQILHFREAVRLKPDMPDAHYNLGLAYSDARKYSEAASEFRKAIELKPSFAEARFQLGTALYKMEDYPEAAAEFEQCLVSTNKFESHLNLGSCYLKTDNVAGAIEQFSTAVQLRPNSAEAHYNLGIAYMKIERYKEAYALFQKALEIDPGYREARIVLKELENYQIK